MTDHHSSERYVWYAIVLLFLVNVLNYMDRMALSVLAPAIKAELHLSDAQLGLLVGLAFSLFYAICGIPIARWADRGVRKNIIAITLALWSAMTALCGAAQNFWHLFAARVGVGVGEAGCLPTGQSMIADYVPPRRRPAVYAFHSFGLMVGMMLGMALAGSLAERIGWRLTFVALGLPGIAVAVLVAMTLREPLRGRFDHTVGSTSPDSFGRTVGMLLGHRIYLLLVIAFTANAFVQSGLSQWWPTLYTRVFGLDISQAGTALGVAIGGGSAVGLLLGGIAASRAAGRSARLPLIISAIATALALPAALASLLVSATTSSILLVALTSLLLCVHNGPAVSVLYGVVRPQMRATGGAVNTVFMSVLGLGLGPFCVGLLSDALALSLGAQALRYALLLPLALLPVMIAALYLAARRLPREPISLK